MDSVIIIFIITIILQNIVNCNGIRLRKQGRQLQTHRRRLNVPDGFRIPRRSNNFYAGMGSLSQPTSPPEREHKLGARMSRTGNSMSITYGGNLDKSEEENVYPEYRRAVPSQTPEPVLVVALLPSEKEGTTEEDRYKFYQRNDRRSPQLNFRQTGLTNLNFTEQKRAINLLELPIAHYVKDYHKIELEIQKREAELQQKKQQRQEADIFPPTTTGIPADYLLQSYDKIKEDMMLKEEMMQNQKRYQVMQDEDRNLKKETLMQQYENKQNTLYNNNYESRLQGPRGSYPQASGQSQRVQYPRQKIQYAPVSRPQIQDAQVSKPQMQDGPASIPRAPDNILVPTVPRQQDSDQPPIQFQDTVALSQHTPDQQNEELKFDDEIYNSLPKWQAEPSPPNLADQSAVNLAGMSVERLVSEYRKLEQEIVRRKDVLESYMKSLNMAQLINDDQYRKPEATTELSQPYLSDSELATLFTPQKKRYEETTEAYQFNPDMYAALRLNNKTVEKRNNHTNFQQESGHKLPTGIVTYRKSFHELNFDQLYVIYLQRIRKPKKWRPKPRPVTAFQYAYVDLEHLEDLFKTFRRLRAGPQIKNVGNKKVMPTLHDDPDISTSDDDEPIPAEDNVKHPPRFFDTEDAFNHVTIDQEAPDMKDFMPKVVFDDHGDKYWFYHQEDYKPLKD